MNSLKFSVSGPFVSKRIVDWPAAGMDSQTYTDWQEAFRGTLLGMKESDILRDALNNTKSRLGIEITVFGRSRSVVALDLDNIAETVFDNITKTLVPKEKGSRTPNWEDRHFWKAEISKVIDEDNPRTVVTIFDINE